MSVYLCPLSAIFQYFSDVGIVLNGGQIFTYTAGTSTPQTTYTDSTGLTPNSNPITLASNGRLNNVQIWQSAGVAIKVIVKDSGGNQLGPTFDQISGINDFTIANSTLSNPASGNGADLVANAVRSYDVFATARAANAPVMKTGQTLVVIFEGGVSIADNLGGAFYWNPLSTATDDGLNVIAPTGLSAGRYLRLQSSIALFSSKAATTSRATNTSVSADPDLQAIIPGPGMYIVEAWINDTGGTSAGGLKAELAFSGTATNAFWAMNGNGTGVTAVGLTSFGTPAQFESAQSGAGSMKVNGIAQCTTGGTLTFQWAQQGSNGTASVVGVGSWMRVTRVSASTGSFSPVTHSNSTPGTFTETIPVGASTLEIEAFGGSGSGGGTLGAGGFGGGSGGYAKSIYTVSSAAGQTISYTVGVANGGGASTVSTGTFSVGTMTANGGATGSIGGAGGTASGGTVTNTSGAGGTNGNPGGGGAGITGDFGTGSSGGVSGSTLPLSPQPGGPGLVVFHYT